MAHKPAAVPPGDDVRVRFLQSLNILDTERDIAFDRITEAASTITHSPIALVSLVDGHRQWFKSRVGLDVSETSRDLAFCAHVIAQSDDKLFVVCDALEDERFKYSDLVLGGPFIRFYAGAPLVAQGDDGCKHKIGTLCIIDQKPRNLECHLYAVMETLAKLVVTEIDKQRGLSHTPIDVVQKYMEVRVKICLSPMLSAFPFTHPVANPSDKHLRRGAAAPRTPHADALRRHHRV
jgi:hypothetical protein